MTVTAEDYDHNNNSRNNNNNNNNNNETNENDNNMTNGIDTTNETGGASSSSSSPSSSLLRVLCLHDERSNSYELSRRLDSLGERLYQKHGIDLVFVDGPLVVGTNTADDNDIDDTNWNNKASASTAGGDNGNRWRHRHPLRAWWEEEDKKNVRVNQEETEVGNDDDDNDNNNDNDNDDGNDNGNNNGNDNGNGNDNDSKNDKPQYVGLDASLLLLKQVYTASPFWGILAVGQAAGVAALLPLLPSTTTTTTNDDGTTTTKQKHQQQPAFMIFINGSTLMEEDESLTEHLDLPCLHLFGTYHKS
jgi:hypothetical protein